MALTDLAGKVVSESDIFNLSNLPPEIISKINGVIMVLKTAGIIFIGYLIFLIIYLRTKYKSKRN